VIARDIEELTENVRMLALKTGADLVGFAPAEELDKRSPRNHRPSDLLKRARTVITLASGRSLNEEREYVYHWGPNFSLTYIYLKDEVKWRRKQARPCINAVTSFLRQKGFKVVTEAHGWSGILSFKMAACLAGLGVLGKGNFVVHPELGPLNVLASIVTDAPLRYGNPLDVDVCRDCVQCIKACKYGAFKRNGDRFRWLANKCRAYDLIMNPVTLKWTYGPCNSKCVNVCPAGNIDPGNSPGKRK